MKRLLLLVSVALFPSSLTWGAPAPPKAALGDKAPAPVLPKGAAWLKDPVFWHALDLRARRHNEADFTKATRKYGVEAYADGKSKDGLYISEAGSIAVVPARSFKPNDKARGPVWRHGLSLTARPGGKPKKYGLETYRDDVNGNLVYINENGQVAVAGAVGVKDRQVVGKPKGAALKHTLKLGVRKAGEKGWARAKQYAVEVYEDKNNGTLIYLSETGSIAIVGAKMNGPAIKAKGPVSLYGMELAARKVGEAKFTKDTKRHGVEVYRDHTNSALVFITESGNISVVPGKVANAKIGAVLKAPRFSHGTEAGVRRADEEKFTRQTKKVNIEAYRDENAGCRIYILDTGSIAAVRD
jgi:hypothetical protein